MPPLTITLRAKVTDRGVAEDGTGRAVIADNQRVTLFLAGLTTAQLQALALKKAVKITLNVS